MNKFKIAKQYYVTQTDVQNLLSLSQNKARRIYKKVSTLESQELGEFRAHDNKVALKNILKHMKIDFSFLIKQLQLEEITKKEPSECLTATGVQVELS